MFLIISAGLEWFRYFRPQVPQPVLYSMVALMAGGFAGYRVMMGLRRLRALRLGRDGEKVVGQCLEGLRDRSYRVIHDFVGEGFNLDHVLIGPAGVFVIETKTRSKRSGNPKIDFDGETIRIDGFQPDRNPVVQAKAQASWLRTLLRDSAGRRFEVRSVIVYPGWWVDENTTKETAVWVLEPKRLRALLEREPRRLSDEDIHLVYFHLGRFVRTLQR